jgi:nitronate monooxygenase
MFEQRVLVAPMAGGPTTSALVIAAARAGSFGFLAAGYTSPDLFAAQLAEVRAAGVTCGANLFAPNPVPVDPAAFRRYAELLQPEADRYGLDLAHAAPREDDDHFDAKVEALLSHPVPVVSFTFGIPARSVIAALKKAGSVIVQTVTSVDEARLAVDAGVDALAVQSWEAGGHWGTLTPDRPPATLPLTGLVAAIHGRIDRPIVAAGGLGTAADIKAVLAAGAEAVAVGTVLLRAPESGASAAHKAALADPARERTVQTRAFSGRPARGLHNRFIERYAAAAPLGYPAVHHLTSPLRKAAGADPDVINLWAGTGFRHATAEPLADILARLEP